MRPADMLKGKVLGTGWEVGEKLPNNKKEDDIKYSTCYEVRQGGEQAFLKVVDLHNATSRVGDVYKEIERIASRANREREIAELCTEIGMKNVVRLIEAGEYNVGSSIDTRVHFIIYERAKCDGSALIEQFGSITKLSIHKRLTLIHNITNALRTLHKENVAHQDLKPPNVLEFLQDGREVFKIGDFDTAIQRTQKSLLEELEDQEDDYMGTYRFAPIELLYGYVSTDWEVVRKGTDFYLLGSLICYYFTGRSMTELYRSKLIREVLWERKYNADKFLELKEYIDDAFEHCLGDIANSLHEHPVLADEICIILRKLCNPDPAKRGEENWYGQKGYKLTLIRVLSKLGNLKNQYRSK